MYISNTKSQSISQPTTDVSNRQRARVEKRKDGQRPFTSVKHVNDEEQQKTAKHAGELTQYSETQNHAYAQQTSGSGLSVQEHASNLSLIAGAQNAVILDNIQSAVRGQLVEQELPSRRSQRAIAAYQTHQTLEERSHITQVMGIDDYA